MDKLVMMEKRLSDLKAAPYNPRVDLKPGMEEYEKLKRSIEEFGIVEPIVFNQVTGYVVGGHQRLNVLKELNYDMVPVCVVALSPDREKALNMALNKISGAWDDYKLRELLIDLDESYVENTLSGFSEDEIEEIIHGYLAEDVTSDEPPEPNPITKAGETWLLGFHKLIVGEQTREADSLVRQWERMTGLTAEKL